MATLIAVISFAMALGALWFSSELAKRAEAGNKIAVKPHLAPMHDALRRAEHRIRELSRGLEVAARDINTLKAEKAALEQDIGIAPVPEHSRKMPSIAPASLAEMRKTQPFTPSGTYTA